MKQLQNEFWINNCTSFSFQWKCHIFMYRTSLKEVKLNNYFMNWSLLKLQKQVASTILILVQLIGFLVLGPFIRVTFFKLNGFCFFQIGNHVFSQKKLFPFCQLFWLLLNLNGKLFRMFVKHSMVVCNIHWQVL